ncbi:C-type lectin domain family 2 member D6-like isoform X2 [Pelodiscus sinensis]|uniref:C-type lectin domain family 2 member D6-like isoform X2 n=1 Tax=Pelodiscus sinensis TaxID=13735 RepID=UPI003F6C68C9
MEKKLGCGKPPLTWVLNQPLTFKKFSGQEHSPMHTWNGPGFICDSSQPQCLSGRIMDSWWKRFHSSQWKCKLPDPQGRGSLSSPSCQPPLARRKNSLGPWENTHRMSLSVPTRMLMQEKAKEFLDLLWPLLHNGAQPALWKHPGVLGAAAVIGAAVVIIIALAAALGVERSKQPPPCPPTSGCPENWIRIQGKFYYFSKAEGNWTNSQKNCSSHAASLATIESLRQLADWTTGLASGRTQAGSGNGSMAPSSTIGLKYKGEPTVPT